MSGKRWLWRAVQIVLLALVGWGIYRVLAPDLARISLDDLRQHRPNWVILAVSTALLLVVYVVHALLWQSIAIALSGQRLALQPALKIYFVSSLGRYLPGKLWQIAGLAVLAQRHNFSPVAATAASLVGQLAFLTTGILLLAIMLPALLHGAAAFGAVALLAASAATFFVLVAPRGKKLRQRVLRKVSAKAAEAGALLDQMTASQALRWWAYYAVSWLLLGAAFTLFVLAFAPDQLSEFRRFAGTVAASYLTGYILFTPAGIGVREGVMMTLLSATLPGSVALLVAIGSRVWFTAGEILPLAFIPLLPNEEKGREAQ